MSSAVSGIMKTTLSKLTKKSWYESCESEARPGSVDMGKQGGGGGLFSGDSPGTAGAGVACLKLGLGVWRQGGQ